MARTKIVAADFIRSIERTFTKASVEIPWRNTFRPPTIGGASRGELEEAVAMARESVALADGTGYLSQRGECHTRLGEVLRQAGQNEAELAALSGS